MIIDLQKVGPREAVDHRRGVNEYPYNWKTVEVKYDSVLLILDLLKFSFSKCHKLQTHQKVLDSREKTTHSSFRE